MPNKVLLALAFMLIVIVAIISPIGNIAKATITTQKCRSSVFSYAQHKVIRDESLGITCPTDTLYISDKDEEKIKTKITNEIYECWNKFGSFKYIDPFPQSSSLRTCIFCSNITFKREVTFKEIDQAIWKQKKTGTDVYTLYTDLIPAEHVKEKFISIDDSYTAMPGDGYATIFIRTSAKTPGKFFQTMNTNLTKEAFQDGLVYLLPGKTAFSTYLDATGLGFGTGVFSGEQEEYATISQGVFLVPFGYADSNGCYTLTEDPFNVP